MTTRTPHRLVANRTPGQGLTRALRAWLVLGAILCLAFPALRGSSHWLGWLPLWFVVTPLVGAVVVARDPWREARALRVLLLGSPVAATRMQARRTR